MSGGRPSRGAKVVYREVDSDDSDYDYDEFTKVVTVEHFEDNSEDEDYTPGDNVNIPDAPPKVVYPPLTPIQLQLRKFCRLGDKDLLKTFLSENPGIELDVRDPDGGTLLTEAATKTAQFCDIAEVLIQAGAGLEVTDSLGNTPLHNAVLYYPSTQKTVDLLLQSGASVTVKNNEGVKPEGLAEDKDLKLVLKELRTAAGRKKSTSLSVSTYLNSPDLRKKVYDRVLMESRFKQTITVKFNSPVVVNSPGLLKRKRKAECLDDSFDRQSKRIRWCELDSTGTDIDPQFSSEEDECVTSQDEDVDDQDTSETRTDSEEDVVIVHDDVKKSQLLQSDTELSIGRLNTKKKEDDDTTVEDVKTCFLNEAPAAHRQSNYDESLATPEESKEEDEMLRENVVKYDAAFSTSAVKNDAVQADGLNAHEASEERKEKDEMFEEDVVKYDAVKADDLNPGVTKSVNIEENNLHAVSTAADTAKEIRAIVADANPEVVQINGNNEEISDEQNIVLTAVAEKEVEQTNGENSVPYDQDSGSQNIANNGQLVLKCSQGFGFFVS